MDRASRGARNAYEDVITRVRATLAQDDGRDRDLAEDGVSARHDDRLGHGRVIAKGGLDLRRRDVLAAAHDPVGSSIEHEQAAVGVDAPDVAGPQPAVAGPGSCRRDGIVEIAIEGGPAPDLDLADASVIRAGDPELDPGQRAARARGMEHRLGGRQRGHAGPGLGQAVGRDDRPAGVEGADDERRRDLAATKQDGTKGRRWRRPGRDVEESAEDGRARARGG